MPFLTLNELEEKELIPGYRGRFVHSENMTLAYWEIKAGAAFPEHSHPHEQIVNVIEGQFELTVEGERRILESGSVVVLSPNVVHGGKARTDCRIIDAFHPVREDYS